MAEKTQYPAPSAFSPYLETVASLFHPVAGPVYNSSARFHGWKESLGLVQPGTVENLTREVSRMSAARYDRDGAE
jgi:mitochondrial import receptor subunit TOM40